MKSTSPSLTSLLDISFYMYRVLWCCTSIVQLGESKMAETSLIKIIPNSINISTMTERPCVKVISGLIIGATCSVSHSVVLMIVIHPRMMICAIQSLMDISAPLGPCSPVSRKSRVLNLSIVSHVRPVQEINPYRPLCFAFRLCTKFVDDSSPV